MPARISKRCLIEETSGGNFSVEVFSDTEITFFKENSKQFDIPGFCFRFGKEEWDILKNYIDEEFKIISAK